MHRLPHARLPEGNATSPGCDMQLLQPAKVGNLDCTFCLDCVRSCPHENVGVLATVPGRALWSDPLRATVGRISQRADIAALVVLLTFGAFANAAGMTGPVLAFQDRLQHVAPYLPRWLLVGGLYGIALLLAPALLISLVTVLSGQAARLRPPPSRFCLAIAPIGFAMWIAHYSFHLLTSYASIVPTAQQFAARYHLASLGEPLWQCACCQPAADWLLSAEILMLEVGMLLSLYAAFRSAEGVTATVRQTLRAFLPWAALIGLLFATGVWILLQPMEMRGTLDAVSQATADRETP